METKIKLNWEYAKGEFNLEEIRMVCVPARGKRMFGPEETDAELCIKDGANYSIAEIHLGDIDSSNTLCKENARRWNDFPRYHDANEIQEDGRILLAETKFGAQILGPNNQSYSELVKDFEVKRWIYTDEIFKKE